MIDDLVISQQSSKTDFQKKLDSASNYTDKISCYDGGNPVFAMYLGKSVSSGEKLYACASKSSCFYSVKENGLKICSYLS
jgi:hypothetical protein